MAFNGNMCLLPPSKINSVDIGLTSPAEIKATDVEITNNLTMSGGNIVTSGLVDGRDVSIDGTALDNHLITLNPHSITLDGISPSLAKGDLIINLLFVISKTSKVIIQ